MTAAKEHADTARRRVADARLYESTALIGTTPTMLISDAQSARLRWVSALVSFLRFVDALPEPVVVPPVPQPSDEAKRRGLLVGAVVRDVFGDVGRVVSHGSGGLPLVQWRDAVTRRGTDHLTVIRPAPPSREPNAEAVTRGLYIGALVANIGANCRGEVIAWDRYGNPVVLGREGYAVSWSSQYVTLDGDAS